MSTSIPDGTAIFRISPINGSFATPSSTITILLAFVYFTHDVLTCHQSLLEQYSTFFHLLQSEFLFNLITLSQSLCSGLLYLGVPFPCSVLLISSIQEFFSL